MKQKISITMEKDLIGLIEGLVNSGKFRNRSHVVEYGLNQFVRKNGKL